MKIGIMGGTFDPIHSGHLLLATCAYEEFQLDKVWFLPNGNPPHKSEQLVESKVEQRVEMVKKAIKGIPCFTLSLLEVECSGISYSYKTMEVLKRIYPEHDFYFILGADSLFSISEWKYPERFLKTCIVLVAFRDDKKKSEMHVQIEKLLDNYVGAQIKLLQTPLPNISSSVIRNYVRHNQKIENFAPKDIVDYIEEKGLYKEKV